MNNRAVIANKSNMRYLLYFSFLPLLIHGVIYLEIGAPYIFILFLTVVAILVYILHFRKSHISKMIKIWSLLLISYGIVRFLLASVNLFMDSIESTITYQLTLSYHIQSLIYIIIGLIVYLNRSKMMKELSVT